MVFAKDDVDALQWSSYILAMTFFVILPIVIGFVGVFLCVRSRRRRVWGAALLSGLAILSIPALLLYGMPIVVLLRPTPTQAATKVDTVLGTQPSDVISMDIIPYTRPKVGTFPLGYVTFGQSSEIAQICDALHSARPNHCDYGKGTSPFFHPDPQWQSYFIIQTKTAKHTCYVTKLKSDSTLVDIFYDMGLRSRAYLGTYKSDQLATVLESLAELRTPSHD
jgi:hypothetical protein